MKVEERLGVRVIVIYDHEGWANIGSGGTRQGLGGEGHTVIVKCLGGECFPNLDDIWMVQP